MSKMSVLIAAVGAGILVALSAAVQHLDTVLFMGRAFVLTDRSQPLPQHGFAGRAARTLQNNVESAAMVIPLALIIELKGNSTPIAVGAAALYVLARIGFTLSYWAGIYTLRSVLWAAGMVAVGALAWFAALALT
jgi:uncharacterized MAPEG superfamily protein